MATRLLAVVGFCLLVGLAGCAGLGDGHVAELRIDISGSGNVSAGRSCVR